MTRVFSSGDLHKIKLMASKRLPITDIATLMDCCAKTLDNHPETRQSIDAGWAEVNLTVSNMMIQKCKEGNVSMLIWYSKQYLGCKEPQRDIHATIDPAVLLAEIKAADAATFIDPPEETEG